MEAEARLWAENEGIEFRKPDYDELIASVARSERMTARRRELVAGGMSMRDAFRQTREEFAVPEPSYKPT